MESSSSSPRRRRALGCAVAVAAALAIFAETASASGPAVIVKVHQTSGLVSTYFNLSARPGTRIHPGSLELDNPTAQPVIVRLDPVDAITTSTLGSAYRERGGAVHGPTTWLRLSSPRVVIPPNGHADVDVIASVPARTPPGDYLTGIAVEALNQNNHLRVSRGLAIGEIERYAIGVELTLPGARHPRVRFTGAGLSREPSGLTFFLDAVNRGNAILKNVHGWAWVTQGRRTVASMLIPSGTFVSETGIAYPVPARAEHPAEGTTYRVRALLHYRGGVARLDTLVTFGHTAAVAQQQYGGPKLPSGGIPWWVWAIVAAAVVAILLAVARRRRRDPVPQARVHALLAREVAAARPLSVIHIGLGEASRSVRRKLARTLRTRVRQADRVCDLGDDGLMVVLPETDSALADSFASDLGGVVARDWSLDGIGTTTAFDHVDPLELIERARANHGDVDAQSER